MTMTETDKPKRGGFSPEARAKSIATRAANKATKDAERKAGSDPKPPQVGTQLAGLTIADCAAGCTPKSCVISGKPYCAHPAKGGLQPADSGKSDALARLNEAKRILGDRKLAV